MGYFNIYAQDYDFKVNGIAYNYLGKTATVVSGSDEMDTIRIPEEVTYSGRTYKITKIGDYAFQNCESLRYISLPKSIQEIGRGAFYCNKYYTSKLSSIILPDSLVSIGNSAFRNCILLNTIAIPNKVKTLGEGAFYGCTTLKSISLSKELTDIGIYAFYNCEKLEYINLPNGIINIGDNTFTNCRSLQTLIIPSTLQTFCTLEGCTGLYQIINLSSINIEAPHSECVVYDKANMINIKPTQIIYNGCLPTIDYENNLKEFDASVSFLNITKDVGTHNGTAHVDYSNNESSFSIDIPFQYTITPAQLAIMINNAQREYGESNPEFTYAINGFVSGESETELDSKPTISCNATTNSSAGNYPIKASASAKNYSITVKEGTLSITKAPVIVQIENATKEFGEQNPNFSISYIGLKNNEARPNFVKSISFSTSATVNSSVGKYDIIASGGESNNYDFTQYLKGVLTVEKAPLTITAKSAAKYYFDENPEFSVSYSGFKNGDDASVLTALPQVSTDAKQDSDAGEYKLSVSGCVCQNYEPKFVNGVFTIMPRDLTIKANDAERVYGEENPNFTYEYDGFINDENENVLMTKPILSTNATKTSDVGTYTINVSGAKAVNYKPIYKNGTLTINKASQQIVWEQDLEDLKLHDQVGLNAEASSGLEISYTFDDPSLVS